MSEHLVTGHSVYVHFECGRCRKPWDQPGTDPRRPGWNVCPHCLFDAPSNVVRPPRSPHEGEAV